VCGKILEEAGVLGDVSSLEFPLLFQPLEPDLLSMEITESFSDLYLVCRYSLAMQGHSHSADIVSEVTFHSVEIQLAFF